MPASLSSETILVSVEVVPGIVLSGPVSFFVPVPFFVPVLPVLSPESASYMWIVKSCSALSVMSADSAVVAFSFIVNHCPACAYLGVPLITPVFSLSVSPLGSFSFKKSSSSSPHLTLLYVLFESYSSL